MIRFLRHLLLFLTLMLVAFRVEAVTTPQAEVRLLVAQDSVSAEQQQVQFGLDFRLEEGWKIYWRAPGAGGKPPILHWKERSENVVDLAIQWPFPQRFRTYGLLSNGYADRVIFPLTVQRKALDQGLTLAMKVDFFICKELCIPDHVILEKSLPLADGADTVATPEIASNIATYLQQVPTLDGGNMRISDPVGVRGNNGRMRIEWNVQSPHAIDSVEAFFDAEAEFHQPLLDFQPDRKEFRLSVEAEKLSATSPVALVLASKIADKTVYSRHEFSTVALPPIAWGWVLLVALAGGMLINVMPCVLPVLMVKILGALKHRADDQLGQARAGFLAVALGIVSTFGVLGVAFALLRAGGTALHWGMQFQQPVFLVAMLFVLMAFATQLLGWWHIRLPTFRASNNASGNKGLVAEFTSGVIAAVLATPCSAPLVGVSISLALFLAPMQMVTILLAMGVGMALPYFLLATFPPILRLMPKPGAWMTKLKFWLALSVFGTALWVAWLLVVQVGLSGAMTILFIAALMVFALAMAHFPETKIAPHRFKLAVLLVALGMVLPARFTVPMTQLLPVGWQEFVPEGVPAHVQAGKTVLVDITADWCITCKVNDKLVFGQDTVRAWRQRSDVVAMRGDWSRPDPRIKAFLAQYQRQALPFAILFTPQAPEGILLPELISMKDFRRTIREANAPKLSE